MNKYFAGSLVLYKAGLREAIRYVWPWMLAVLLLVVSSLLAYENLFATPQDRQSLAMTISANPAFNLIFGTPTDLTVAEGFAAWRSVVLGGFLSGLMAILAFVKLTRAKEDSGEAELIRSNPVGRFSTLWVGLATVWTFCAILGLLVAVASMLVGARVIESVLMGVAMVAAGVMFSSVAAASAQIGSHARSANSYAVSVLGFSYLLRGFADTVAGAEWVANVSPLGWIQKLSIAGDNSFGPLSIFLVFTLIIVGVSFFLNLLRDYGQGLIADTPGADRAGLVRSVEGLVFKLQQNSLVSWLLAFAFIGSMFGYMASSIGDTFASNEGFSNFIAGGQTLDSSIFVFEFIRTLFSILGIIAAVFGVQVVHRLYSEEMNNRIAPLLAGDVKRIRLLSSFALIALVAPALALCIASIAVVIVGAITNIGINEIDVLYQGLLTIPATLILVSIGICVIGLQPKVSFVAWFAIAASFTITILGPILELSDRVMAVSPFWHVGNAAQGISLTQTVLLTLLSIVVIVLGYIGFLKRDIARV